MLAVNTTEETPLLVNPTQDIYSRFSFRKKQSILLIISLSSILTCERTDEKMQLIDRNDSSVFAGGAFVPTIAVIAKDLNCSQEDIK
jgi:hypothetical protein